MTLSPEIKEELRNKQGELLTGIIVSGVSFLIASIPYLAAIGLIVAAGACFLLGTKDFSSGRKDPAVATCLFAAIVFLFSAGIGMESSRSNIETTPEAAVKNYDNLDSLARVLAGFFYCLSWRIPYSE